MQESFRKRTFSGPGQFLGEAFSLLKSWRRIRRAMRSGTISPEFRERLMLAVTSVNDCRYCARYHGQEALKHGISQPELERLLAGEFSGCPQRELPAIIYAQHWAENDGRPSDSAVAELKKHYSPQEVEHIRVYLRMIRMGNLAGNSWDYILSRLSWRR
jgi:AhpD family alkylhydroperoxidase